MQLLGYSGLLLVCSEWLLGGCHVVARVLWTGQVRCYVLGGCHVVARVLWTGQVRCYRFARGCVSFRRLRPPEVSFKGCIHHRGCLISEKQVGHSECDLQM